MIGKLSGTYTVRPSPGPHKLRESLPMAVSSSHMVTQSDGKVQI